MGQVPSLVKTIQQEDSPKQFLNVLSELMHTLMHQYPGFPDLYEPVLVALQVSGHMKHLVRSSATEECGRRNQMQALSFLDRVTSVRPMKSSSTV